MNARSLRAILAAAVAALLPGCAVTYQCDVYDGGDRISTTWYDAPSAADAEEQCEEESSPFSCDCYEDH